MSSHFSRRIMVRHRQICSRQRHILSTTSSTLRCVFGRLGCRSLLHLLPYLMATSAIKLDLFRNRTFFIKKWSSFFGSVVTLLVVVDSRKFAITTGSINPEMTPFISPTPGSSSSTSNIISSGVMFSSPEAQGKNWELDSALLFTVLDNLLNLTLR